MDLHLPLKTDRKAGKTIKDAFFCLLKKKTYIGVYAGVWAHITDHLFQTEQEQKL